jgi:hypothetical protein
MNDVLQYALRETPYSHFLFSSILSNRVEKRILDALESVKWETQSSSFFRFSIPRDRCVKKEISGLVLRDRSFKDGLREFEKKLNFELRSFCSMELHRYAVGDGIGPHTDCAVREVRCIINLNRCWKTSNGGVWLIASDSSLKENTVYIPAVSNTGFIFSTSRNSYHALAIVTGSETYGLTFRFSRC